MRNTRSTLLTLPLLLAACDPPDESGPESLSSVSEIPAGALWGPCDLDGADEPDSGWWGCDGELGSGLACLRPLATEPLSICVPQTWDPQIEDDCGGLTAPFGLGVATSGGSAYCVVECSDNADCGPALRCSAYGMCAWPES